jgi:hypothetical protein
MAAASAPSRAVSIAAASKSTRGSSTRISGFSASGISIGPETGFLNTDLKKFAIMSPTSVLHMTESKMWTESYHAFWGDNRLIMVRKGLTKQQEEWPLPFKDNNL